MHPGQLNRLDRIFLVITNRCSGRCKICSYRGKEPKKDLALTFIRERVLPLLRRYSVQITLISGGEPTLHPQLPGIVEEIKNTGSTVTLITNASGLTDVFHQIKDRVDAYLFSVDAGSESLHREIRGLDNFDEILAWPGKIKAGNPSAQVAFSCVLQKQNVGAIVDYYRVFSDLPGEALFFNVPELKTHCFGRRDTVPEESLEQGRLTEGEIAILEESLGKILEMDAERGKLGQSADFFADCVKYFRHLKGERVEFPDQVCPVPLTGLVIDEGENLLPCFYLPFSFPFPAKEKEEDILNRKDLKRIRRRIAADPGFRKKHCRYCLQFHV